MISQLEGVVTYIDENSAIILTKGVGYSVGATKETLIELEKSKNQTVLIWTYLAVRESSLDLYGFLTKESKDFFELLITVSGIGPKSALAIMNLVSVSTLRKAISKGDPSHLSKVTGIGAKKAEKIVLELKDKLTLSEEELSGADYKDENDALEALQGLGYSQKEARDALKQIAKEHVRPEEKIKHALKILAK